MTAPRAAQRWAVWSRDLFDRECPPRREAAGEGLAAGLAALWELVVSAGVVAEGGRSFTDFYLRVEGASVLDVSVPVERGANPELLTLRRWASPRLFEALGAAHATLLGAPGAGDPSAAARALLARVAASADEADLVAQLAASRSARDA